MYVYMYMCIWIYMYPYICMWGMLMAGALSSAGMCPSGLLAWSLQPTTKAHLQKSVKSLPHFASVILFLRVYF